MHSHILKEVCVHSQKINLGCKFDSLHLKSKGKFVPECIMAPGYIFLKHCSHGKKNTWVQICTWMQKYTQVQVLHMNVFRSKCYLKTADQGVHNYSEAHASSLTQIAFIWRGADCHSLQFSSQMNNLPLYE